MQNEKGAAKPLHEELASLKIVRPVETHQKSNSSPFRSAWVVGGLMVLAIAGGLLMRKGKGEALKAEISTTVISQVSPTQGSLSVTATGYVVPEGISRPGAKSVGRLSRVLVKEGDTVKAGQVLAELDDGELKNELASAQARIAAARARAKAAQASRAELMQQVEREKLLVEQGVNSRAHLEDMALRQSALEMTVQAYEAEAQAVEAEADRLRVSLRERIIVAPIDGTVISKPPDVGTLLGAPLDQATLLEIADLRSLVVDTDVPEGRFHLLRIGGSCEIVLDAYPSKRYRGVVVGFGKRVNRAKATIVVKVKFDDTLDNAVLPEMAARVSFLSKDVSAVAMNQQPKLVVPASAVVERSGQKMVFVVEQDNVRITPVTLGAPLAGGVELLQGPSLGTRVVDRPSDALVDGQQINEVEKS